jgi:hypothetical protein
VERAKLGAKLGDDLVEASQRNRHEETREFTLAFLVAASSGGLLAVLVRCGLTTAASFPVVLLGIYHDAHRRCNGVVSFAPRNVVAVAIGAYEAVLSVVSLW